MKNIDYEEKFWEINNFLRDLIADELDLNRNHIQIHSFGEIPDAIDEEGDYFSTHYFVNYYQVPCEEPEFKEMIWEHRDYFEEGCSDFVMTVEEFFGEEDTEEEPVQNIVVPIQANKQPVS